MTDFANTLNVMVVGATGGIGGAFVQYFEGMNNVETIHACARSKFKSDNPKIHYHHIDYDDEDTITNLFDDITDPLDIIIVATGILRSDDMEPEKQLKSIRSESFRRQFLVNTIGPALVAKHGLPKLNKNNKSVFAALSARVGSISDNNNIGGWYSYRASKAALNMILKSAGIEMKRTNDKATVLGLHPGTVDTNLSKPFQGNVPDGKLFTPDYAVSSMMDVVLNAQVEQSGSLYAYDGEEIQP